MSETTESRVSYLERQNERTDERLRHVERQVSECLDGVRELLDRDARRPSATNWRLVGATTAGLLGMISILATSMFWFISVSPAVIEIRDAQRTIREKNETAALITCLRSEIANAAIGWKCGHERRGQIAENKWQPTVSVQRLTN